MRNRCGETRILQSLLFCRSPEARARMQGCWGANDHLLDSENLESGLPKMLIRRQHLQ